MVFEEFKMWNLMNDTISLSDKKAMCDFIMETDRFTSGQKVRSFETAWNDWQGCKHSVFVNSGSSANLILVAAVKHLYGGGTSIAQSVTWSTNVAPLMQLGYQLQLCDVDLTNLGPDVESVRTILESKSCKIMFLTHVLGFNALSDELLSLLNEHNVILLEDCCEAVGGTFRDNKVGNFGIGSTFSFYFGHHMTTVEGGMVCTNDDDLYDILRMMRSHGLLRESANPSRFDDVNQEFTFMVTGFNVRNTEIYAELGLRKLATLDQTVEHRNRNLRTLLWCLNANKFMVSFNAKGASNYALPIVCLQGYEETLKRFDKMGIEHRPIITGSLYRQPFMQEVNQARYETNAEIIHSSGLYIGNHEGVSETMIRDMCKEINR